MAGTKEGAKKGVQTIKQKYGEDFYSTVGTKGGAKSNPNKGFGSMTPEERKKNASKAGKESGRIRRKRKTLSSDVIGDYIDIPLEEE